MNVVTSMVPCMDASQNARADFDVMGRQIAVLYPAFRCGTWCPLALMESADLRLISPVGFSPLGTMQAWRIAV